MILQLLLSSLLVFFSFFASAQDFVYIDDEIQDVEEAIEISREVTFPDIRVQLGKDISFEDIKVGITNRKNKAHYILTEKIGDAARKVQVDNCDNFPDLRIEIGSNLSFPDYRIELVENEYWADILIYSEKVTLSEQELIACLLPLIREKTGK